MWHTPDERYLRNISKTVNAVDFGFKSRYSDLTLKIAQYRKISKFDFSEKITGTYFWGRDVGLRIQQFISSEVRVAQRDFKRVSQKKIFFDALLATMTNNI